MWIFTSFDEWPTCLKTFPQVVQTYGFSLVWIFTCSLRWLALFKLCCPCHTSMGLFLCVNFHMISQTFFLSKSVATCTTNLGLLTCVMVIALSDSLPTCYANISHLCEFSGVFSMTNCTWNRFHASHFDSFFLYLYNKSWHAFWQVLWGICLYVICFV